MTEMATLEFAIRFHTPFRISTGYARPGFDAGVDAHRPLPSSSLKGAMRATALRLLQPRSDVVDAVFGSTAAECPWLWHDAVPDGRWHETLPAARVSDRPAHPLRENHMFAVAEQIGADTARFTITQRLPLDEATQRTIASCSPWRGKPSARSAPTATWLGWVRSPAPPRNWTTRLSTVSWN